MEDIPHSSTSTAKAGLLGGLVGAVGLAVSVVVLSSTAGASSERPADELVPTPAEAEVIVEADEDVPAGYEAAYSCFDDVAEKFGLDFESDIDEEIVDAIDWDALDAESEKCNDLFPQDVQDQIAAEEAQFEEYNICVSDAFSAAGFDGDIDGEGILVEELDFDGIVSVFDGDEETLAAFGEGDGSITITKAGDEIAVSTNGDVTVETFALEDLEANFAEEADAMFEDDPAFEEFDAALAGCDDELPEGFDFEAELAEELIEN